MTQWFCLSFLLIGCMDPAFERSSPQENSSGNEAVSENIAEQPLLSESCPDIIFPHPADWKEGTIHGTCAARIGIADCRQCHGQNLEGQAGPACSNCHHPDNWTEITQHPKRFTNQRPTISKTTCMICHGENYAGGLVGVACNNCHRLSHLADWRDPKNHGARYCEQRGGNETDFCNLEGPQEADCFSCHKAPIVFDKIYAGVTPAGTPPPACYECHAVFPHIGYQVTNRRGETVILPWKSGHRSMILSNTGLFVGGNLDSPQLVDTVRKTCGNGGGCHTNGRFSTPRDNRRAVCANVCHKTP